MKHISSLMTWTILIHIVGWTAVTTAEALKPGLVSGVMTTGWWWLTSVGLLLATLWIRAQSAATNRE